MMRKLLPILISTVLLSLSTAVQGQTALNRLMNHLESNQFDSANAMFSPQVADMLSSELLAQTWQQLQLGLGSYRSMDAVNSTQQEGIEIQEALAHFEQGALKVVATLGEDGLVGFRFFPLDYVLPDYGRSLSVGMLSMSVEAEQGISLEGELILPKNCDNCPVVVLVHGSGPADMDETVGPNKPFKDIALGLAKHGVGSFRYNKRSFAYPEKFRGTYTMQELTVDDAVTAVALLHAQEELPIGSIYVAGHSLGGYALPRILSALKTEVAGGVVLAGPSRGMGELILEQTRYLTSMDDTITAQEQQAITITEQRLEYVRSGAYADTTPHTQLMGLWPGSFWRDVMDYDPTAVASEAGQPLLVLQGAKDCQVFLSDMNGWRAAGDETKVRLISYPDLNHLFMPIETEFSHPSEYQIPNNVDEQVIIDMVKWIGEMEGQ